MTRTGRYGWQTDAHGPDRTRPHHPGRPRTVPSRRRPAAGSSMAATELDAAGRARRPTGQLASAARIDRRAVAVTLEDPAGESRSRARGRRPARAPRSSARSRAAGPATSSGQLTLSRRCCQPSASGSSSRSAAWSAARPKTSAMRHRLILGDADRRPRRSGRPARTRRSIPSSTPPGRSRRVVRPGRRGPSPPPRARPDTFGSAPRRPR